MIKLLAPLGLLGLLSIVVLIIIYIIKPNYQQKLISSTFVWKLSLRYRKKKLPISKLRNILIIICQILILTASAAILAKPMKVIKNYVDETEVIAIIDASASMRADTAGETRFERAVDGVLKLTDGIFSQNGIVSVIVAENTATFLAERITTEQKASLSAELGEMIGGEELACTYGVADIEGAMLLCEDVLLDNPKAQIYLYTDTQYSYVPEQIKVVSVAEEGEWNAAILGATAELENNYYTFYVDVACYGKDQEIGLEVEVHNANAENKDEEGVNMLFSTVVECTREATKKVVFINADLYQQVEGESEDVVYYIIDEADRIFSYQSIHVAITGAGGESIEDSFQEDNTFQIYNGQKEVVRIQYASSDPNPFFTTILLNLKKRYADRWDVRITSIKEGDTEAVATEGFDFYIFEHQLMPDKMPTDGVVILADPYSAPIGSGLRINNMYDLRGSVYFSKEEEHAVLSNVGVENITISRYTDIVYDESSYQILASCNSKPVMAIKNEPDSKVIVMGFSVHYSNFPILMDFPIFMYNMFGYFMPSTTQKNSMEVNERFELNARGEELLVYRDGTSEEGTRFEEFPASMSVVLPGTYVLQQTTFAGKDITEYIYVKIPSKESNIWSAEEALDNPYKREDDNDYFDDLLLYIAAALVAILFLEWWLQSRDNM